MHIIDKLTPDYRFDSISDIPIGFFSAHGITALICDIDNTLVTYDDAHPTKAALDFFARVSGEGVSLAFASNNKRERVTVFNSTLGYFAEGRASKPRRRVLRKAMTYMKSTPKTTAILGDQIFTDIYCGHRLGLTTILVPPIKDKKNIFFKFKRVLEKPFLARHEQRKSKSR